ncbi:hypothetical protein GALL_457340 [mine drainage metagenome]|uniref:Uncharacterized protein n=1 Tax=mine drainage metagenome TaxID=410659 RepID=A0A1J5Q9I1_9ZZZZ
MRLPDGRGGNIGGCLHLTPDLVDRRCHFLGGRRHRLHIGGGFSGRRRHDLRQLERTFGICRQGDRGIFQPGRSGRNRVDDLTDCIFEIIGKPRHVGLALRQLPLFRAQLFLAKPLGVDQRILENAKAARNAANLVAAITIRDLDREVARCEPIHHAANPVERTDEATAEKERREGCDEQAGHSARGNPYRAAKDDLVDIVDVDARLDHQGLVAGAVSADVGELGGFLAADDPRNAIFHISPASPRLFDEFLNHVASVAILEVPTVDVDVFGV